MDVAVVPHGDQERWREITINRPPGGRDERAAEAAAVKEFGLDEQQRTRLVVNEMAE